MIKKPLVALTLIVSLMAVVSISAEPDGEDAVQNLWMKKKLDHSKEILAGLVTEDFDAIVTSARAMNDMNQFEKVFRAKSRDYRDQLTIFEIANRDLIRQAEKDNLDGATRAYLQLTSSCVSCHKVVRDQQRPPRRE